eukprot:CFRG5246T1
MGSSSNGPTTSAADAANVADLKAQMAQSEKALKASVGASVTLDSVNDVEIDEGRQKYVLIKVTDEKLMESKYLVRGKKGASYHADVARPVVESLAALGLSTEVTGGGRIICDMGAKSIHIFGFSYGFGLANHRISQSLCENIYPGYNVSWSNEGY